jgi:2-dehydro-3-deoxygluconokinase
VSTAAGVGRTYDLLTFGETMVRLAVAGHRRLEDAEQLEVSIGGTESNVAVALARLGRRATWLSALPDNPLGRKIDGTLRRHGVDTGNVIWKRDARAGLYFLDAGAPPRPTRVVYDRASSAVARLMPGEIDPVIAAQSRLLHLTGITPALSEGCAEICLRLAAAAHAASTPVVLDVNYRSLLWSPAEAASGLQPLLDQTDILFCGAGDAATIWDLTGQPDAIASGLLDRSAANLVIVTLGSEGAYAAFRDGQATHQPAIPVEIIDPVGAGDAFAAGFLHHWLDDSTDLPTALRTAATLAALQMTIPGDLAIITQTELTEALEQAGGDIVR